MESLEILDEKGAGFGNPWKRSLEEAGPDGGVGNAPDHQRVVALIEDLLDRRGHALGALGRRTIGGSAR